MALVDHEYLYLLKVQIPGLGIKIWLTNLTGSQFYAAILAGWLTDHGILPTPDILVEEIDQLIPDWSTHGADGEELSRDEFVQLFSENSNRTYEAIFPW